MAHESVIEHHSAAEAELAAHVDALCAGRHGDPFAVLGPHQARERGGETVLRVFAPHAEAVHAIPNDGSVANAASRADATALSPHGDSGFFSGPLRIESGYRLAIRWPGGAVQCIDDPYRFGPLLGDLDLHLLAEGRHRELARCLGAHAMSIDGVDGVRFAVWAPNARRVSVIGDFNSWDGRIHPMRLRPNAGVWELFLPQARAGARYKYEILGADGAVTQRADPVALAAEPAPATASVVIDPRPFEWHDEAWMARRTVIEARNAPMSVYEVHVGSWLAEARAATDRRGRRQGWRLLAERLVPYVQAMGFTHIELLPVMEHPFGGSWGYQPLGLFAPTARYGAPEDFAAFVDACHCAGIGVLLDWVPAHFPTDPHGLARFDGTPLYEHADPKEGFHQDWNTLIYNLGRHEVRGFMIASAIEWLRHFHVDGLRVDAVASMLYRDYSRREGEWVPNVHGGRENLENVAFLRELNEVLETQCPGTLTIAEESTAWPGVTAPVDRGGLGFDFKWNMGWMHDTLQYMTREPVHRSWHHDEMTFGLVYAYSEAFVLPLSHDEVVHGKGSLFGKMPGDERQRLAQLRAYFGFMWGHPGKKLLFMGGELAQPGEWNHDAQIDWGLLEHPGHAGVQWLVRDLNRLHSSLPALHELDASAAGFAWVVGDDRENSVFAFLRRGATVDEQVLVVCNFTPMPRQAYRIGVPQGGDWQEVLNSDAQEYGGSGLGNGGSVPAQRHPAHGHAWSLDLTLPPLSVLYLQPTG